MNPEEIAVHEEAVRLRRMTDKQLVEAFHRSQSVQAITASVSNQQEENNVSPVGTLLKGLSEGKCKGIGKMTARKISQFATGLGLIP